MTFAATACRPPRLQISPVLLVSFVFAVLLSSSTDALAAPRYAVLIGQNVGRPHEARLRYAEADAIKVAAALRKVGDFAANNTTIVQGDGRDQARQAVVDINARIRREAPQGAILVVYYSGHADEEALHFGRDDFDLDELHDLVLGSPAALRILVVDACRSGVLTQRKGGTSAPPFDLVITHEPESAEGFIVLTAASAGEDAQESPLLQGSFFTHHFVSGLLGAADDDDDGAVTLEEATSHAYVNTVRHSSGTVAGTQHPRFSYDVRGAGSMVLTRTRNHSDQGRLELPADIDWLIFRSNGAVIAEVPPGNRPRTLTLPDDTYFLRGRGQDALFEGEVEVIRNAAISVVTSSLKRVDYARLVRKGGSRTTSHAISAAYVGHTTVHGLGSGFPPCHGARVAYGLNLRFLSVDVGGGLCTSSWRNEVFTAFEQELSLDANLSHTFDLPIVSLQFGGGGGVSLWQQSFVTRGEAPTRYPGAPFFQLRAGAFVDVAWGLFVGIEAMGRSYFVFSYENPKATFATPVVLGWTAAFGWQF